MTLLRFLGHSLLFVVPPLLSVALAEPDTEDVQPVFLPPPLSFLPPPLHVSVPLFFYALLLFLVALFLFFFVPLLLFGLVI